MNYHCECCDYNTLIKQNYENHLKTRRHMKNLHNVKNIVMDNVEILHNVVEDLHNVEILHNVENPEPDTYNVGVCHEISLPYVSIIRKEYHRIYHIYPNKFRYVKYMDKAIQEIKDVCDGNRYKKWEKNNAIVNLDMYKHKFSIRMAYILVDIRDLYAKPCPFGVLNPK